MEIDKGSILSQVTFQLDRQYGVSIKKATTHQLNQVISRVVLNGLWPRWSKTREIQNRFETKQVCYLSVEYLMGRTLGNILINLGVEDDFKAIFENKPIDFSEIENSESDAALGNGGLGRLAACFLDSLATKDLPVIGYGLKYKYGMFEQTIENGYQVERPDNWMANGDPWSIARRNRAVVVEFGGDVEIRKDKSGRELFSLTNTEKVIAIPYDLPIVGYKSKSVNTLRLWEAEAPEGFDLQLFNRGKYLESIAKEASTQDLTRVLYPNDNWPGGKVLRLKQQYFLVSATLQDILDRFMQVHGSNFTLLPEKITFQLNDTHPILAIPELMRILLDIEGLPWGKAWTIVEKLFAYTNHTVLSEALETWDIATFRVLFPRLYQIIEEINRRFLLSLKSHCPQDTARHRRMSIIGDGVVKMAWLGVAAGFSVNGVAALHTQILKDDVMKDWFEMYPDKFNNKTNGVTQRRWLLKANPGLANLITEKIGDGWITNFSEMEKLKAFSDDQDLLDRIMNIKRENKIKLTEYILKETGMEIDSDSIFDIQVKRLHEYKRQLLNIFHIIHLYFILKQNPSADRVPRTFIFAAKSAPGYERAKLIIKLINDVANTINDDPEIEGKLKVVFIPNYGVSLAEIIIPSADLSEQISTAGKEASGTGNMKFMINGAITIGTMDGANVEIVEEAGEENEIIFGMNAKEVGELNNSEGYDPVAFLEESPNLKRILESLTDGSFNSHDIYRELSNALLYGEHGNWADPYYVLKDFASYVEAQEKAEEVYKDTDRWKKMVLANIASSGKFSSDRTIGQYAEEIWKIEPITKYLTEE